MVCDEEANIIYTPPGSKDPKSLKVASRRFNVDSMMSVGALGNASKCDHHERAPVRFRFLSILLMTV